MDGVSLERFEHQVDALLHRFDRVKTENKSLREKQAGIMAERDALRDKQHFITATIERLIQRLKLIESEEL